MASKNAVPLRLLLVITKCISMALMRITVAVGHCATNMADRC